MEAVILQPFHSQGPWVAGLQRVNSSAQPSERNNSEFQDEKIENGWFISYNF